MKLLNAIKENKTLRAENERLKKENSNMRKLIEKEDEYLMPLLSSIIHNAGKTI